MSRIAYLVLPTYDWSAVPGADSSVVKTLVALNLLPSELASYGRAEDAATYRGVLEGLKFEVTCDKARVDRASFKKQVSKLSEQCETKDDVFVLVYSGHGHQELMTRHASLVFSDNKTLTSYELDRLLKPAARKGSVYTILSCCTATGMSQVLPVGMPLSVGGQAAVDIVSAGGHEESMAGLKRVEIFSTSHVETQKAAKDGTLFCRALAEVLKREPALWDLQKQITDAMKHLCKTDEERTTVKVVRYNFDGKALGPFDEESTEFVTERMDALARSGFHAAESNLNHAEHGQPADEPANDADDDASEQD